VWLSPSSTMPTSHWRPRQTCDVPFSPRDVTDLSRVCRGRHGEVGIVELGLYCLLTRLLSTCLWYRYLAWLLRCAWDELSNSPVQLRCRRLQHSNYQGLLYCFALLYVIGFSCLRQKLLALCFNAIQAWWTQLTFGLARLTDSVFVMLNKYNFVG